MARRMTSLILAMMILAWASAAPAVAADKAAEESAGKAADKPAGDKPAADKPADGAAADEADDTPVAAVVNGREIRTGELESLISMVVPDEYKKSLNPQKLAELKAQTLAQLIDRRIVAAALAEPIGEPTKEDIDAAIETYRLKLSYKDKTIEQVLEDRHTTMTQLREQMAWQVLWDRAVKKYLSNKTLERYFIDNRRQFDGSEIRASHILFRPSGERTAESIKKLMKQASAVRAKIDSGEMTFAQAAEKYSAGPSREKGGDLGFFPRHGVNEEALCHAAFALQKGQLSEPIETPSGVHLILVTDVKPGRKTWADVADDLRAPAAKALFANMANRERPKAKVEFKGAWPHFKLGTQELETGDGAAAEK